MPYRLRKAPKRDLYWVVAEDGTKKSKEPLPREDAEAQMRALYAAMRKEGGVLPPNPRVVSWTQDPPVIAASPHTTVRAVGVRGDNPSTDVTDPAVVSNVSNAARILGIPPALFPVILPPSTVRRGRGGVSITKPAFIKEHKNLLGVLKRGKRSELNAEYADQSKELSKVLKGSGPIPDRNILQQFATQSYQDIPANRIGQFQLALSTPTLKIYKDEGNTIVVAIRGTKTTADWTDANSRIAIGQLENSNRYKTDLATLQQFQLTYPPSRYDYYGVGHSLGGAILDLFLKAGLIKNGVSYNPAVQPQDFSNTGLANERIYSQTDPLYAVMGQNLAKKPEVRAPPKKSWWQRAISVIPYAGKAYDLYKSHQLDQFAGGAKSSLKFAAQLRRDGIEPSLYLKEAQRRAKLAGLPYKLLGFSDDGVHKLAIPDESGRMIRFGRVGYGDHLIWAHLEKRKKVPMGTADAKRNTFHKSHSAIKGDWKSNPFSPNNLALKILW